MTEPPPASPPRGRNPVTAAVEVLTGRRKIYYGWRILAASVVAVALANGVSFWAFGLYVQPLESEFGWTRAEVSLAFSLMLLASGLAGPFIGRWIDVHGPRSAILIGAGFTTVSYLLLATTGALWQWYLYSALNAMVRQFMVFIPFMILISRWFDRRRGIAVGVLGSGFSLGGFAIVPLLGFVISTFGWRGGLVFSGVAIALLFFPLGAWVIRNDPRDVGESVDGGPAPDPSDGGGHVALTGATLGEALRTPQFWVLSVALTLFFFGMVGWIAHQIPFYESAGFSRSAAAGFVAIASGCGIIARVSLGLISDRIGRFENVAMALAGLLTMSMVILWFDSSLLGIAVFITFWIVGSSGGPMMEAILLTRAFGLAHFGAILGAATVIEMCGQVASPTVAGWIFDTTGTYDLALMMFAATFLGSFILFAVARRMPPVVAQRA